MISRRRFLATAAASTGAALLPSMRADAADVAPGPPAAYLMGYFTESPAGLGNEHSLHLAYSHDGLNWTALNDGQPVLTPAQGERGLRDPFLFRKQDGSFGLIATNMWNSNQVHFYDSPDLVSFTDPRLLTVNDTPGMHAWAPEAFYDPARRRYGIVWAGNSDRHRQYVNYTTDFRTLSPPQVFHDPGFDVIDATFDDEAGGTRYMYVGGRDHLQGNRSDSLDPNSFTAYTGLIGPAKIEGPDLVKVIGENRWYLYGDHWSPHNAVFLVWESTDLAANDWAPVSQTRYTVPVNCKHGSTVHVTQAELDRLITAWGTPTWSRLKSYSQPGSYVRHANYEARIDPYPFDPFQDAMWRLVPGLADPSGVSFESVNLPGHFLRHENFLLRADRRDDSALFRADATYVRTPGLADSAASSFRSYNYPGHYIRHANSRLRIDPITTAGERADATYLVVV